MIFSRNKTSQAGTEMNGIEPLMGTCVHGVSFGVTHFQIQVSTAEKEFSVSTSADVSFQPTSDDEIDFRDDKNCSRLVGLLGAEICGLSVDATGRGATLFFDEDRRVKAWWPGEACDSLFVVRNLATSDWWVIG